MQWIHKALAKSQKSATRTLQVLGGRFGLAPNPIDRVALFARKRRNFDTLEYGVPIATCSAKQWTSRKSWRPGKTHSTFQGVTATQSHAELVLALPLRFI